MRVHGVRAARQRSHRVDVVMRILDALALCAA